MKKTKKTMDLILLVIAIVLIVFTVTMIAVFLRVGSCPDILITSVFGACLGEFGFMAWIKNTKERNVQYDNNGNIISEQEE